LRKAFFDFFSVTSSSKRLKNQGLTVKRSKRSVLKNVFITGVSGYFGQKLVSFFDQKKEIKSIFGIDVTPPALIPKKMEFIKHDVRDDIYPLLSKREIDWAIHAAYILPPLHNKRYMEDVNINGTKNFLESCASSDVKQLLYCSSTTAYGFHPDNPPILTEESELRGNDDFTYAKNKRELELICRDFRDLHPDISLTVIRPCFVVGPGFDNPLSRHLQKGIVLLPSKTAPFQFIHEDDLVEIIFRLLLEGKRGEYNLTADGTMTFDEMIHTLGNVQLKLPFSIMSPLNNLMWFLRLRFLTEFPSPALNMVRYAWIASNDKIKRELNYSFKYTTREAFEDFARHVKKGTL
jgi:UDP-glucose 4-epimerase